MACLGVACLAYRSVQEIIPAFIFWKNWGHHKLLSRFTDIYFVFHCFHQFYQPNSSRVRVKPRFCSVSVKFSPSGKSQISSNVAPRISFKRITLKKISNRNNQESPFKSEIYKCCTCCENCDVIRYLEITVSIAIYNIYIPVVSKGQIP